MEASFEGTKEVGESMSCAAFLLECMDGAQSRGEIHHRLVPLGANFFFVNTPTVETLYSSACLLCHFAVHRQICL